MSLHGEIEGFEIQTISIYPDITKGQSPKHLRSNPAESLLLAQKGQALFPCEPPEFKFAQTLARPSTIACHAP